MLKSCWRIILAARFYAGVERLVKPSEEAQFRRTVSFWDRFLRGSPTSPAINQFIVSAQPGDFRPRSRLTPAQASRPARWS
jgi:hypothetical protein